jgi:hypothetical protein
MTKAAEMAIQAAMDKAAEMETWAALEKAERMNKAAMMEKAAMEKAEPQDIVSEILARRRRAVSLYFISRSFCYFY